MKIVLLVIGALVAGALLLFFALRLFLAFAGMLLSLKFIYFLLLVVFAVLLVVFLRMLWRRLRR